MPVRSIFTERYRVSPFHGRNGHLQKKNQVAILGCEGIEWIQSLNTAAGTQNLVFNGQEKPQLQSVVSLIRRPRPRNGYVLVIKTWDQISVDQDAARQVQLDKMTNL